MAKLNWPDPIPRLIDADNELRELMKQPAVSLIQTHALLKLRNSLRYSADCIWGNRKGREKDTPEA
jgi:hypothetical protein